LSDFDWLVRFVFVTVGCQLETGSYQTLVIGTCTAFA